MAESKEKLNLLKKLKEESEKAGLKFNIQKTKIRASGPITWEWKQWQTLFSWAPKLLQMVTAAMKLNTLALWKKSYDQPRQHIEKQRHYFANKICLVKAMGFPVVMYGCEIWTIKKVEHQRADAFELWC